jgi:hypothetical protein
VGLSARFRPSRIHRRVAAPGPWTPTAATVWTLLGVPLVAAAAQGVGKSTLLGAFLDASLPPDVRIVGCGEA